LTFLEIARGQPGVSQLQTGGKVSGRHLHTLVVLFISIAIFDFNPKVRNATLFG